MALVKYGGGIVAMSGSIGGMTYAKNRSGNYVRAWSKPINPNTDRQDVVRSALAYLADRWHSTVTALQRAAWNLYAGNVVMKNALGEATYLSGYNHYIRSNMISVQLGIAPVDAGPTTFNIPEQDPAFALTADASDGTLDFAFDDTMEWCDEVGAHMFIFQGKTMNETINFFDGPWRALAHIEGDGETPPSSPEEDVSVVFAIDYNQNIFTYARILRADGRLSEPFRSADLTGDSP